MIADLNRDLWHGVFQKQRHQRHGSASTADHNELYRLTVVYYVLYVRNGFFDLTQVIERKRHPHTFPRGEQIVDA